ncbi:MAG: chemotaxis histidine kinase [Candidatus Brocadia sinica]|nr:MAG: chemotaxis histidine kinase [Candidatus Brocadia sinica]MCK6469501.1 chemotaxis protein CheA [Candidatus Brocadia sinica]NUO05577.1 chemotaxis protein CheA [Candidatus Brocadia sinica]
MEDNINFMDDVEIVKEFLVESSDHLEDVESKILVLEENPEDVDIINGIFRPIHSMKGSAGFLGLKDIGKVSHELETLLDEARKAKIKITPETIEILYEGVDILKKLRDTIANKIDNKNASAEVINYQPLLSKIFAVLGNNQNSSLQNDTDTHFPKVMHIGEILLESGDISKDQLEQALEEQGCRKKLGEILVEKGITTPEKISNALKVQSIIGKPSIETVKVDTQKLDNLVNLVGELVIANALISETFGNTSNGANKNLSHLNKIVKDIQDQVMCMRMVPLKSTFQKMVRLVRDVSAKVGKKVRLEISGEDTELDKTVIEEIGDPLVHIIRNSIDHGIESQEERVARGKPADGLVRLNAFHQGGNIVIEIEDDGKGLCKEKILKKAIEKGLIEKDASLSEQQIYNLIFAAGFSTADKVTDVSGRGVGMDVVKKNVERLRGKVEISTAEGKGTKISIKLPLTMAIIDGMIVQVGPEKYIVPMLSIEESIRPKKEDVSTVQQRGELINVRGNLLPMVRLHSLYNVKPQKMNPWEALILIVEGEGRRCGILVDDLLGQQQIVIKSLGERFCNIRGISGSAILGNGHVGLILDVGGIMSMALN